MKKSILQIVFKRRNVVPVFLALLLVSFMPGQARAAPIKSCANEKTVGAVQTCCDALPGFFYRLENCTTSMISIVSESYLKNIVDGLKDVILTIMSIAIVLFGFRLAADSMGRSTKGEAMKLVLKLGFVAYFLFDYQLNGYVKGLREIVAKLSGVILAAGFNADLGDSTLWMMMDKTFYGLLGVVGDSITSADFGTLIPVILAFLISGPIGMALMGLALGAVLTLIFSFVMALYIQFTATIVLTFLSLVAPIFVPLILFESKMIKGMFEQWVGLVLNYTLQPIVLCTFLALMVGVLVNLIGFNPVTPNAAPAANSILGMIKTSNLLTTCSIITTPIFALSFPCINGDVWDSKKMADFGGILFGTLAISAAMFTFLRALPNDFMLKLTGGIGIAAVTNIGGSEGGSEVEKVGGMAYSATSGVYNKASNLTTGTAGKVVRAPFRIFD